METDSGSTSDAVQFRPRNDDIGTARYNPV